MRIKGLYGLGGGLCSCCVVPLAGRCGDLVFSGVRGMYEIMSCSRDVWPWGFGVLVWL